MGTRPRILMAECFFPPKIAACACSISCEGRSADGTPRLTHHRVHDLSREHALSVFRERLPSYIGSLTTRSCNFDHRSLPALPGVILPYISPMREATSRCEVTWASACSWVTQQPNHRYPSGLIIGSCEHSPFTLRGARGTCGTAQDRGHSITTRNPRDSRSTPEHWGQGIA